KTGGRRNFVSVSPDGRWLAYYDVGSDGLPALFVRDLSSLESRAVSGSLITNIGPPLWSTDSRYVAFTASGTLNKVAPEGGTPQPVYQLAGSLFGSWNPDGVLIRASERGLERVAGSEQPALLHAAIESDGLYSWPQFLPDGRHYLFSRISRIPERA